MKRFLNKYPLFIAIFIVSFTIFILWWLNQPVKIIYKSDAPPFPYSVGAGDDPRR
jgi:hypothetical protein